MAASVGGVLARRLRYVGILESSGCAGSGVFVFCVKTDSLDQKVWRRLSDAEYDGLPTQMDSFRTLLN